jgi:transglutaminase-like putative cysteine protease
VADQKFNSNSTVTYDVGTDGTTTVSHDITLQNITSDFYATSYTLALTGISPINPIASEGFTSLPVKVSKDGETTSINISFPNAVVGEGNKREFLVSFQDKTLVNKSGEIWEITTPKLADATSFNFYSSIMKIPTAFGNLAYISPNPSLKSIDAGKQIFTFDKDANTKSPVTAAFGQFQVFSFNLSYHIENPLNQTAVTDIALPPDTNYQKMNYTQVSPKPTKITIDPDGNWLATFQLKAHEKINVSASGSVQIFPNPIQFPKANLDSVTKDLGSTDLWQTTDPKIAALAHQLKTPKAIYDYVSSNLTYDYAKVAPNVMRLGATGALNDPKSAICTEFTDLFIALARAAGIPAREIEGFAYTENPQIQPLSLVADVLHAWPEYWDTDAQAWVPVDPTWGSTSGIDYFNKLDLRHFAFVIHGSDSKKPYPAGSYKLGPNPQKDVNVTFGQLPQNRTSSLKVSDQVLSQLPFSDEIIKTTVYNPGPVAVYDSTLQVVYDNAKPMNAYKIDIIPPYGSYETTIDIPYSFLGQKIPNKVELLINDSKKTEFGTYKTYVTISNLLMICLLIFAAVMLIYLKFRDSKAKKHTS